MVLTYFSFKDALIQTYTLPYVRIIRKIIPPNEKILLFTVEKKHLELPPHEAKMVRQNLLGEGIEWRSIRYHHFGWRAFAMWAKALPSLLLLLLKGEYKYLHCWCMSAGGIGYVLSVLSGKKLIADSYEPHAEASVENKTWNRNGAAFKILFYLEKLLSKKAVAVVAVTEGMRGYALEKYNVQFENFFVKPACVNLDLFSERNVKNKILAKELNLEDKIVCVYAGKYGGIYLEQEIFNFFKVASDFWKGRFRALLLTNHQPEEIHRWCRQADLSLEEVTIKFIPHQQIPDYIGLGDFAITPIKPVPSKRFCSPIKNGEYWALGLPIVIPAGISDDSEIIEKYNIGAVYSEFTDNAYRQALIKIDEILKQPRQQVFEQIRAVAQKYRSFDIAVDVYENLYGEKGLLH